MTKHYLLSALIMMLGIFTLPTFSQAQDLSEGPELDATKDYYAIMDTTDGLIFLEFYPDVAPIHVRNFVNLAEGTREFMDPVTKKKATGVKYYDGVKFHRIIKDFMVQGGDRTGSGSGRIGYTIPLEVDPSLNYDKPYLLAMARTPDPNSASAQFFITTKKVGPGQKSLNQQYTIFGKVLDEGNTGETIDKMELTKGRGGIVADVDRPVINSVKILRLEKGTAKSDVVFAIAKELGMGEKEAESAPASKPAASTPASKPASKPASRPVDSK